MSISHRFLMVVLLLVGIAHAATDKKSNPFRKSTTQLHKLREDADPKELGVVATYAEAKRLEEEISTMYSEIRATNLSLIQRQLLERSLKNTKKPVSKRAAISAKVLDGKATTAEDIAAYQKELAIVMRETDAIVANARDMLQSLLPEPTEEEQQEIQEMTPEQIAKLTETSPNETGQERREAEIKAITEQADKKMEQAQDSLENALKDLEQAQKFIEKKKEQLAKEKKENTEEKQEQELAKTEELEEIVKEAEEVVKTAVDAIKKEAEDTEQKIDKAKEVIKKLAEALKETKGAEKQLETAEEKKAEAEAEKAVVNLKDAGAAMEEAAAKLEMAKQMAAEKLSGNQEVAKIQALENLSQANSGKFLDISKQMHGLAIKFTPKAVTEKNLQPPPIKDYFKGVHGRKIVAGGGTGAVWFYLDDWYLIGPYDNAGRKNIETVFPPQSIVDLDATYFGKNNRQIKWNYDSFNTAMVQPGYVDEYTIYFGYTELWCYQPMDLWIAIGSDDRSDLWINGMPAWHSSNVLKSWNIGEGYRKVHFKQGRNKILFRLENGWHTLGMSVLVCTYDPRKTMK